MITLSSEMEKFQHWFIHDALPLWASHAYDDARGGFYEALNFDATPSVNRPRRVRVQARQIHTFTQTGIRGWHKESETIAAKGFDYFLDVACPDDGARGCVHIISDDGKIIDDHRDLYDQAFLLLACASRWQAAQDRRAIDLAEKTIRFLDAELASPHGGWLESDQNEVPRRQNPHMHLLEAFMALYRATDDKKYLERASDIVQLFLRVFYDEGAGTLIEYFNEDFSPDEKRHIIEPGHMFEWGWLLKHYEHLSGTDYRDIRNTLYMRGIQLGEDPQFFGFVSNKVDMATPNLRAAKRLWPQTEYLKASLIEARDGNDKAKILTTSLIESLFATYLHVAKAGLWVDEFDALGTSTAKDVPASILYHLFEAVAETYPAANSGNGE